ncbi:MAG: VCBS repeat-containing protein [Myxococcales bacterium]|nr:VCBS repeat-containing protein [Myxococcales bacterium]
MKTPNLHFASLTLGLALLAACSTDAKNDPADGGIDEICLPGEICATVNAQDVTGDELRLILFETEEGDWPQKYRLLPTPTAIVRESPPIPASFPIHIRIPMDGNIFAFSGTLPEGTRLGLAVATGVAATFTVSDTDARGFSESTLIYDPTAAMDYGAIELSLPAGATCDLNPFHPSCLTGRLFWEEHFLGDESFVPGAIYMDVADVDKDGTDDIITVGEPHFEEPELPLSVLKLGVYYLNPDSSLRETEVIDRWSEEDQTFYSPWGVKVIDHGGEPMIIVGTNIPELAPLEDGSGRVLSYHKEEGAWVRSVVRENPNPTVVNYNAVIVVVCDIDNDMDDDIALAGAFGTSSLGSWLENTGNPNAPWIEHLTLQAPDTDPLIRGTLAYKCADLNKDGYPEVVHNAMFDVANSNPPQFRGEIWLALNPGPGGWDERWEKVVIDDDNWASADMWFHDFDGDTYPDLIANQIFDSTVTRYRHPGADITDTWEPEVIISGLKSPSDFWLADIDGDYLVDVVSADHTAHRGVWHKNPGPDSDELWELFSIYRDIRLPGDFEMNDHDGDDDLDWLGISLTRGQAFVVEQVEPASSLVATIRLPNDFGAKITKLIVTLAEELPVTGIPAAILATIENVDKDGDGELDVDQILSPSRDLVLALKDVGETGDYHVVVALYVEGGGEFIPVPGVDYQAESEKRAFGEGKVEVALDLAVVP